MRLPSLLAPKNLGIAAGVFGVFAFASAVLWFTTANSFYLLDLPFIGISVVLGILWDRRITQLLIGGYFFVVLNWSMKVNMQIEGLFLQTFAGVFTAAFVHYAVAKIGGPLMFGRGFCAYGCWTSAILDLLPWGRSPGRRAGLGALRYVHLGVAAAAVGVAMAGSGLRQAPGAPSSVVWFLVGAGAYYLAGLALAWALKDNRAFCKYLCPIAPLMKLGARWAVLRVRMNTEACDGCGRCERVCPMDVPVRAARIEAGRVTSTECILCGACQSACPRGALAVSFPRRR